MGARRSRPAVVSACLLSLAVHGTSVAALSLMAGGSGRAARLDQSEAIAGEWISVSVTIEGTLEPVAASSEQAVSVQARAAPARRRPVSPVLALPVAEPMDRPEVPALSPPPFVAAAPPATPVPEPPRAAPARMVSSETARALRIYDTFPNIAVRAGYARADVDVRICVSEEGTVRDAWVGHGATSELFSETLRSAVLRWRYRPLLVDGRAEPFCHLIRISYQAR